MGFGWSFYGFFIIATLWLLFYFAWAGREAARDRRQGPR
jgi:hypothetical protein